MKPKNVKGVLVDTRTQELKVVTLDVSKGLKTIAEAIGCEWVEIVYRYIGASTRQLCVCVDEEGLLKPNVPSILIQRPRGYEMLVGSAFICGVDKHGDFKSLSNVAIKQLKDNYHSRQYADKSINVLEGTW